MYRGREQLPISGSLQARVEIVNRHTDHPSHLFEYYGSGRIALARIFSRSLQQDNSSCTVVSVPFLGLDGLHEGNYSVSVKASLSSSTHDPYRSGLKQLFFDLCKVDGETGLLIIYNPVDHPFIVTNLEDNIEVSVVVKYLDTVPSSIILNPPGDVSFHTSVVLMSVQNLDTLVCDGKK
jgi:hypothetical protein